MSEPRSWSLHGFTVIHRDMEIGEVTHCEYKERIIGSKIGEAVVDVIEKSAFDELKRENEKLKALLKPEPKSSLKHKIFL